jgi:hypothetical protein
VLRLPVVRLDAEIEFPSYAKLQGVVGCWSRPASPSQSLKDLLDSSNLAAALHSSMG